MNWHCAPVVKHLVFEAKVWGSNPPRPRPFDIYLIGFATVKNRIGFATVKNRKSSIHIAVVFILQRKKTTVAASTTTNPG